MAFLKDRKHDVFVSYAHVDNIPDREGEKGWVEGFAARLRIQLLKRAGEEVAVWRDPKLSKEELFDSVIEKAIRDSGIVLALITPRYLKSEYCNQELVWFNDSGRRVVDEDHLLVFPILLYNIPNDQWPSACKGALGFEFYDAEYDEFGVPLDPDSKAFEAALRELVESLHKVLVKLKAGDEPEEDETESNFTVFMATPADDLGPTWRQLSSALKREGIDVVGGIPPPYEEEAHAEAVAEAMAAADLSVHLLSARAGEPIDENNLDRTYPLAQVELGKEHAKSQLILIPDEVDLELIGEDAYAGFVQSLVTAKRDAEELELVHTGRHQMIDEILAKHNRILDAIQQARMAQQVASAGGTAFIDLHTQDLSSSAQLLNYLAGKNYAPVMVPEADTQPSAGMAVFEENLKKAQVFIVVFGGVARDWVHHRLNEAFKLILSNNLKTQIGVYLAPSNTTTTPDDLPPFVKAVNNPEELESLLK